VRANPAPAIAGGVTSISSGTVAGRPHGGPQRDRRSLASPTRPESAKPGGTARRARRTPRMQFTCCVPPRAGPARRPKRGRDPSRGRDALLATSTTTSVEPRPSRRWVALAARSGRATLATRCASEPEGGSGLVVACPVERGELLQRSRRSGSRFAVSSLAQAQPPSQPSAAPRASRLARCFRGPGAAGWSVRPPTRTLCDSAGKFLSPG